MKKNIGLLAIIFVITGVPIFAETLKITLLSDFRLNPILGINGDEYEANSKFVQRMLFSPLVFPVEDPYLKDNFEVALDLSLVDELWLESGYSWIRLDLSTLSSDSRGGEKFRVHLRNNLYFREGGTRVKNRNMLITSEDVVYSYRLAHITADRIYNRHLSSGSYASLGLNTLLYSKLKEFNNVYIDKNNPEYICFEVDKKSTGMEFLKTLAYVPILSCRQLISDSLKDTPSNSQYIDLHDTLDFKYLQQRRTFGNSRYDMYDFAKIQEDERGRRTKQGDNFYDHPRGYGQYYVRKGSAKEDTRRDKYLFYECRFVKNEDWCNFGSNIKKAGGEIFRQDDYNTPSDEILMTSTNGTDIPGNIKKLTPSQILYNVYLSANMLDAKSDDDARLSAQAGKRMMQISHYLYGIFFGPDLRNNEIPVGLDIREFFAAFADRSRIENKVKYLSTNMDDITFRSMMVETRPSLFRDLQVQRLYYPFYLGVTRQSTSESSDISRYYAELEDKDWFYREYRDELYNDTLENHYLGLDENERYDFYDKFIGGTAYASLPRMIKNDIKSKYGIIRNRLVSNGQINLIIYYYDKVGQVIADHYKALLSDFFTNEEHLKANIESEELNDLKEWKNTAKSKARAGYYTLLVKGWNYKFDILDELDGQFVDRNNLTEIRNRYIQLVDGSGQKAEEVIHRVAKLYVDNVIMIPLVGIQNYVVYRKDEGAAGNVAAANAAVAAAMETYKNVELLLLPWYWRKK
jgi:hypothetical protein